MVKIFNLFFIKVRSVKVNFSKIMFFLFLVSNLGVYISIDYNIEFNELFM